MLPLLDSALAIQRAVLGDWHPDLGSTHMYYGSTLTYLKRYTEAEDHLRRAFEIRRKALGEDHPSTIDALGMIADGKLFAGATQEALDLTWKCFNARYQDYINNSSMLDLIGSWNCEQKLRDAVQGYLSNLFEGNHFDQSNLRQAAEMIIRSERPC